MVLVPAGVNEGVDPDFGPYRLVSPGFYMDRTEITLDQWNRVRDWGVRNGYRFDHEGEGRGGDHPVHTVSWYDCAKWCNARSEMDGRDPVYRRGGEPFRADIPLEGNDVAADFDRNGYRLPGRAYWEYAARGGLQSHRFPWGDTISWDDANYRATPWKEFAGMMFAQSDASILGAAPEIPPMEPPINYDRNVLKAERLFTPPSKNENIPEWHPPRYYAESGPLTAPAESFEPNGYGLYNMVGNVAEWLQTPDYEEAPADNSAFFGGGWRSVGAECRFGKVFLEKSFAASDGIGFRTILPSGATLGEGSVPVSYSPDPPVFHYDAERRKESDNFRADLTYGLVMVPKFTECGWERRQPGPPSTRTLRDAFADTASQTVVVEESIPSFSSPDDNHADPDPAPAEVAPPEPSRFSVRPGRRSPPSRPASRPASRNTPSSGRQPPSPSSRPSSRPSSPSSRPAARPAAPSVPLFHVKRVPYEQADLGVSFQKGNAVSPHTKSFSFGQMTFSLVNRTRYRIVTCVMKVSYRVGTGQDISFSDIPPGEMRDSDSSLVLVGSHAVDDLNGVPFLFPALVLCVDDDGNLFDLYETDANLSVGFLGI